MIIRAKTFKSWMQRNFSKGTLRDICNHGANCGYHGLIYNNDICKLYAKFKDEIWELANDEADSMGLQVLQMISELGGADTVESSDRFEVLMVWFAAEHYARLLTEDNDDQE